MNIYLNFYTGLGIVLIAILISLCRWKYLDAMGKVFFASMAWYFFAFLVSEGGLLYKSKFSNYWTFYLVVRDAQTIIEYTLCVLFFHFAMPELRRRKILYYLLPLGYVAWISCAILFWHTENFTVYFGPFTNVIVIILSIISINKLLAENEIRDVIKLPAFRFIVLMLFFYGCSVFFFMSYPFLLQNRQAELFAIYIMFRLTDVFYVGAGITYFFYPKKTLQIE